MGLVLKRFQCIQSVVLCVCVFIVVVFGFSLFDNAQQFCSILSNL